MSSLSTIDLLSFILDFDRIFISCHHKEIAISSDFRSSTPRYLYIYIVLTAISPCPESKLLPELPVKYNISNPLLQTC
ncbi:hypothetical protein RchiOBHm_Chr2g0163231 [Rosa chinensis]|uniref:Uncharacterized protein n=1 Tax=Rosa chinensis TaxID=74649 RepID=A0A2P6S397_ROSCH|nr:hypothetical protein RchiOBHm_Chr2g0163231 [Rosa chinensis]